MEDYPASYVTRPCPFIFLSGFAESPEAATRPEVFRNGPLVGSQATALTGQYAQTILQQFLAFDCAASNPQYAGRGPRSLFRLLSAGKVSPRTTQAGSKKETTDTLPAICFASSEDFPNICSARRFSQYDANSKDPFFPFATYRWLFDDAAVEPEISRGGPICIFVFLRLWRRI